MSPQENNIDILEGYNREVYSDVVVGDTVIKKGVRDGKNRLKTLDSIIPDHASVLDVGCHLGFFTTQLARKSTRFVVGIESAPDRANIAAKIAARDRMPNVAILNITLTNDILSRWANACEAFNTILFLNVLHHCPIYHIHKIINYASRLSPQIIIETPHVDENNAYGSRAKRRLINNIQIDGFYKYIAAETESHTNPDLKRPMFVFSNPTWFKRTTRPHYLHATASVHKHSVVCYNDMFIHKHDTWKTGVNLGTMVGFNMIYPDRTMLIRMLQKTLDEHQGSLRDVNLWNILLTPDGLKLFDTNSLLEHKYTKRQALDHLIMQYDDIKATGIKPLCPQNIKNRIKHKLSCLKSNLKTGKYHDRHG